MQRYRSTLYVAVTLWAGIVLLGCPQTTEKDVAPKANFKADRVDGNSPLTVKFTDLSTPGSSPIESWYWDFGGDGGTWSTQHNPQQIFKVPAGETSKTFTISLTVTSARGGNTKKIEKYITVRQPASTQQTTSGSTVSQLGVTVTLPKNFPDQPNSSIGISLGALKGSLDSLETLKLISDVFTIRHTRTTEAFYAHDENGYVLPTTLSVPVSAQALSGVTLNSQSVFILALLPDGACVPIPGELQDNKVVASVIRLPKRADYVVVDRADAYDKTVGYYGGALNFAGNEAENRWRVSFSALTLQQLTAIRLGSIEDATGFDVANYDQSELDLTESIVLSALDDLRNQFVDANTHAPLLAATKNTFSLLFYNMGSAYTPEYTKFRNLVTADRQFGHIVIDPMQLLTVCQHNAIALAATPDAQDLNQKVSFEGALAEQLTLAVAEAYEFPDLSAPGPADVDSYGTPQPIQALAGLFAGSSTALGQWADGSGYARGLDANEYAWLSQPLFKPFHPTVSRYAVASQEFFTFVRNAYATGDPLGYVVADAPNGILFSVRKAIQDEADRRASVPNPIPLRFADILPITYRAVDGVINSRFGVSLPQAYWRMVRERAVEHTSAALLRPGDRNLVPFTIDDRSFEPGTLVSRDIQNTGSTLTLSPSGYPAFGDIPPFAARALRLTLDPRATSLDLAFNTDEWVTDAQGNGVSVAVYKGGEGLVDVLASDANSLTVPGLPGNAVAASPEIIVVFANLNASAANSVRITVQPQGAATGDLASALYEYTHTPDLEYTYTTPTPSLDPYYNSTVYWTEMTSGAWRTAAEVGENSRLWKHMVGIVRPSVIRSNTALLVVTGGDTGSVPEEYVSGLLLPFSVSSGSVTAVIGAVPNEPLEFNGDGLQRSEDEIIAYSYSQYKLTGDTTWPALFPMVRAAIRAMDTIQQHMMDVAGVSIDHFVVVGASKRGWTTWLTGASDARVSGIAPMVINIPNMKPQLEHHYACYGDYSTAIQDYWDNNVFKAPPIFNTLMEGKLLQLVDPYSYRSVLTMPKLLINSTGDQFFLPDATQFYFDDLSGDKYIYNAPNTEHGLDDPDTTTFSPYSPLDRGVVESLYSFYSSVVRGVSRPQISWQFDPQNAGRIIVDTNVKPKSVRLWQATNPEGRDFRLNPENITRPISVTNRASEWTSIPVTSDTNQYVAQVSAPATGWTAYYVEAAFANYGQIVNLYSQNRITQTDFRCTTECRVIPDNYPQ